MSSEPEAQPTIEAGEGAWALPLPNRTGEIIMAAALFAMAIFARVYSGPGGDPVHLGHRDVLIVFAALAGVAATFEALGAYVSLGALTAILLLAIAKSALWRVVLGTGLGMVAVWVAFKVLLGVQLPAGPF